MRRVFEGIPLGREKTIGRKPLFRQGSAAWTFFFGNSVRTRKTRCVFVEIPLGLGKPDWSEAAFASGRHHAGWFSRKLRSGGQDFFGFSLKFTQQTTSAHRGGRNSLSGTARCAVKAEICAADKKVFGFSLKFTQQTTSTHRGGRNSLSGTARRAVKAEICAADKKVFGFSSKFTQRTSAVSIGGVASSRFSE